MPSSSPSPKTFVQRSTPRGVLALCRDWGLILLAMGVATAMPTWWVMVPAVVFIGCMQFAIGESLLHEASHHNLVANRRLNDWLEPLVALPFFWTLAAYRREHSTHHRHLGDVRDHLTSDYLDLGLGKSDVNLAWIWWGRPLVGLGAKDRLEELLSIQQPRAWVRIGAFWAVVLGLVGLTGTWAGLLLYWLLPLFFVSGSILRWSELQEHVGTATGTRSNLSPVGNWLFHNNGHHRTHHLFPSIPWHKLPAARAALIDDELDRSAHILDSYRQAEAARRAGHPLLPPARASRRVAAAAS